MIDRMWMGLGAGGAAVLMLVAVVLMVRVMRLAPRGSTAPLPPSEPPAAPPAS